VNLKSSKLKLFKSTFNSIVASFFDKKAFSLEFINFSKVFHLKHQNIFLVSSSQNFSIKIFFTSFSDKISKLLSSTNL